MAKTPFDKAASSDPKSARRGLVEDLAALVVCRFRQGGPSGKAAAGPDESSLGPQLRRNSAAVEPGTESLPGTTPS